MRMDNSAFLFRSTIGFERPSRRRQSLRWLSAVHRRRRDDDDDPPPAPDGMRLAVPERAQAQRQPDPAMLMAA